MLRVDPVRKTFSADIKHRTFGRVHLRLRTKARAVAMVRHAALEQLLDTGEPVRDLVEALRQQRLTIEAVAECVRARKTFDVLRPSTWPALEDAVEAYVAEQEARERGSQRTADSSAVSLAHAVAHFGATRPVESITVEDVTQFKDALRAKGLATNTVGLYLLKLGALYTWLQKREARRAAHLKRVPFVLHTPIDRELHMPPKEKTRHRFLLEHEAARLLEATPASLKAAVALGLFAGLRIGEVVMLRVGQDVDLTRSMLFVQARPGWAPKYRKDREVPISGALHPILSAHMAMIGNTATMLFPGDGSAPSMATTTLQAAMRRVVTDADMVSGRQDDGVTFHTLRHTFASWLVMSGADLFTVARLMGHANTKQVEETYGHLSPAHQRQTVELLTARWARQGTQQAVEPETDTTGDTASDTNKA